ncbi:hypothetical protein AAKU55_004801 [Oxalobacteraceae bacterium GrIS 1.11]
MDTTKDLFEVLSWAHCSGDWLTLTEAAQLLSERLSRNKTIRDVLKAGYLDYIGTTPLNLFAVTRKAVALKICPDTGFGNLWDWMVFPGETFRMSQKSIEELMLLNCINPDNGHFCLAMRTLSSKVAIDGWERQDSEGEDNYFWTKDFVCTTHPNTAIDISDVRVDGGDLDRFIEEIKAERERSNPASKPPKPATPVQSSWIESANKIARATESVKLFETIFADSLGSNFDFFVLL